MGAPLTPAAPDRVQRIAEAATGLPSGRRFIEAGVRAALAEWQRSDRSTDAEHAALRGVAIAALRLLDAAETAASVPSRQSAAAAVRLAARVTEPPVAAVDRAQQALARTPEAVDAILDMGALIAEAADAI